MMMKIQVAMFLVFSFKMEAAWSSKTLVFYHITTYRQNAYDHEMIASIGSSLRMRPSSR